MTADGAFRLEDVRVADLQALSAAPHLSVRLFADVVALLILLYFKDIVVANYHDGHSSTGRIRGSFLGPVDYLGLLLCVILVRFCLIVISLLSNR